MRRLLGALLIAAWPASAQVAMVGAPCQITDGSCAGTFARLPAPSGCTTGSVATFLGSLTCVPGLTYAGGVLSVPGAVSARNFTAIPLPAAGAVTVKPKLSPLGGITVVAGSALADGDGLSVGDGVGVVPIEFDASPGDGTTGGAVAIVFDGTESATQIRDAVKAILDGAGRDWTTSAQAANGIGLVRATPGATGGAITEDVTDAGFSVTDWTPPAAATTYTYSLQACAAGGTCTAAGAASSTAAGVLTLSAYNPNRLSWSTVSGAALYKIRRDVGGATQGVIWSGTALSVDDTGLAGDSTAKPTLDGTGTVTAGSVLVGNGTAAAPSLAFASEPGTGLMFATTGTFITRNGVQYWYFDGNIPRFNNSSTGQIGWSSGGVTSAADTIVSRGAAAATLQLGAANAASPVAQTLQAQGGSGTNIPGATLTIRPGAGTGSATGAALIVQTPTATGSGTTAQTQTERARFSESGFKLASGTRPTCDASTRGAIFYVAGGAGVADTCEVCVKSALDAYAWVSLF